MEQSDKPRVLSCQQETPENIAVMVRNGCKPVETIMTEHLNFKKITENKLTSTSNVGA
jgi:hypothetical protein